LVEVGVAVGDGPGFPLAFFRILITTLFLSSSGKISSCFKNPLTIGINFKNPDPACIFSIIIGLYTLPSPLILILLVLS
jgi:hypothetical protein